MRYRGWSYPMAMMTAPRVFRSSLGLTFQTRAIAAGLGSGEQGGQVVPEQVPDALDRDVRGRVRGQRLRVVRVMPLARKDGRQPRSPDLFHRVQDAQLVVHEDVVSSRVAILDVVQLQLRMDVNQHTALDGLVQPGALDLPGLEDDVAVGQDDRLPPGL